MIFPSVLLTCSELFEVPAICNTLRYAWKAAVIRFGQLFLLSGWARRGYKPVANQQEEDTIGRIWEPVDGEIQLPGFRF